LCGYSTYQELRHLFFVERLDSEGENQGRDFSRSPAQNQPKRGNPRSALIGWRLLGFGTDGGQAMVDVLGPVRMTQSAQGACRIRTFRRVLARIPFTAEIRIRFP
jgi:hypothetical protein